MSVTYIRGWARDQGMGFQAWRHVDVLGDVANVQSHEMSASETGFVVKSTQHYRTHGTVMQAGRMVRVYSGCAC